MAPQDFSAGTEDLLAEAGWKCRGSNIPRKSLQVFNQRGLAQRAVARQLESKDSHLQTRKICLYVLELFASLWFGLARELHHSVHEPSWAEHFSSKQFKKDLMVFIETGGAGGGERHIKRSRLSPLGSDLIEKYIIGNEITWDPNASFYRWNWIRINLGFATTNFSLWMKPSHPARAGRGTAQASESGQLFRTCVQRGGYSRLRMQSPRPSPFSPTHSTAQQEGEG